MNIELFSTAINQRGYELCRAIARLPQNKIWNRIAETGVTPYSAILLPGEQQGYISTRLRDLKLHGLVIVTSKGRNHFIERNNPLLLAVAAFQAAFDIKDLVLWHRALKSDGARLYLAQNPDCAVSAMRAAGANSYQAFVAKQIVEEGGIDSALWRIQVADWKQCIEAHQIFAFQSSVWKKSRA